MTGIADTRLPTRGELRLRWDSGLTRHLDLDRDDMEPLDDRERAAIPGAPEWQTRPMSETEPFVLHPIGAVRSGLRAVGEAPNQAHEGAPGALLEIDPAYADALERIAPGDELVVLTWLHLADREVLQTHPRNDERIPLTGVFRTRSPDRPNPIGVHRVTVTARESPSTLRVAALEAIDGTPIVDLKVAMDAARDA